MILTPELVRQRLDAWGPRRHLEARRTITAKEARHYLLDLDTRNGGRVRRDRLAKELNLPREIVERIWVRMLRDVHDGA